MFLTMYVTNVTHGVKYHLRDVYEETAMSNKNKYAIYAYTHGPVTGQILLIVIDCDS